MIFNNHLKETFLRLFENTGIISASQMFFLQWSLSFENSVFLHLRLSFSIMDGRDFILSVYPSS